MSIDFYVAVDQWPTQIAMQQCMSEQAYPISFKRFPQPNDQNIVNDGIFAAVEGGDAYLEGEIFPKAGKLDKSSAQARTELAAVVGATPQQYLLTIRIDPRPTEFVATAYVISGLVNCFGGVAYEPQGGTRGRADFADSLLSQIPLLESQIDNAPNR